MVGDSIPSLDSVTHGNSNLGISTMVWCVYSSFSVALGCGVVWILFIRFALSAGMEMVFVCLSVSQTHTIGIIQGEKSDGGKVVKSAGWAKK